MKSNSLNGLQTRLWSVLAAVALWLGMAIPHAQAAAKVMTDHSVYLAGENISVSYSNGPGNPRDWIAIYPEGTAPGSVSATKWKYTDGGIGANGSKAGSVLFFGDLAPGAWVAYLLENDGYRVLGQDSFTIVGANEPLVRADKQIYGKNEKITIPL